MQETTTVRLLETPFILHHQHAFSKRQSLAYTVTLTAASPEVHACCVCCPAVAEVATKWWARMVGSSGPMASMVCVGTQQGGLSLS
jgi:hypothetical protein